MKIYVASSWRNTYQPAVVAALRAEGFEVYDFKNPAPGDHGFGWRQCADEAHSPDKPWRAEKMREVLKHPIAQDGFKKDMAALSGAQATVLVLPCGRSAHLELGWATGAGQRTIVLLDDPISEPELMYLMNTEICISLGEVIRSLRQDVFTSEIGFLRTRLADQLSYIRKSATRAADEFMQQSAKAPFVEGREALKAKAEALRQFAEVYL